MANVVPADRKWHDIRKTGETVHAEALGETGLKVWTEEIDGDALPQRWDVRVYATGEALDHDAVHMASATTPNGTVWHLYGRPIR